MRPWRFLRIITVSLRDNHKKHRQPQNRVILGRHRAAQRGCMDGVYVDLDMIILARCQPENLKEHGDGDTSRTVGVGYGTIRRLKNYIVSREAKSKQVRKPGKKCRFSRLYLIPELPLHIPFFQL